METCGNCNYKSKLKYSNYYKCDKYGTILGKSPAVKCEQCRKENNLKRKKKYIEVK